MTEYVWIRVGDDDSYHQFDDIDGAADYLAEIGIVYGPLEHCNQFGVTDSDQYTGDNYISLFWGDCGANAIREVNPEEMRAINEKVTCICSVCDSPYHPAFGCDCNV